MSQPTQKALNLWWLTSDLSDLGDNDLGLLLIAQERLRRAIVKAERNTPARAVTSKVAARDANEGEE